MQQPDDFFMLNDLHTEILRVWAKGTKCFTCPPELEQEELTE